MRLITILMVTVLLSGCHVLQTTPQSPPPLAPQSQEVTRAQSMTLTRLGTTSVTVRGSPDDAERALASKANASGARYYLIQLVSETVAPGLWYASAIFYGPPAGAVASAATHDAG